MSDNQKKLTEKKILQIAQVFDFSGNHSREIVVVFMIRRIIAERNEKS
jgi:hypothetical protein